MRTHKRHNVLEAAAIAVVLAFGVGAAQAQNKCPAGKTKCVHKKASCILKIHEKAEKTGVEPEAAKLAKCYDKYDGGPAPEKGCFAKLEAKDDGVTPEKICPTKGDSAALEAKVDAFVEDLLCELGKVAWSELGAVLKPGNSAIMEQIGYACRILIRL